MGARKVGPLVGRETLDEIRRSLQGHLGERVIVKADKGRRRVSEDEGILEGVFPSIFLVKVNASGGPRRLSYTYSEVATRTVRIQIRRGGRALEVERLPKSA
ncbi:MAG: Veg family protein [Firmicutes bacterium]|jgi:uncharacterized protein Veg|nr:Veg family protein [Bacillota bacterium]